jgi:uracil phosphoribosyltransferase
LNPYVQELIAGSALLKANPMKPFTYTFHTEHQRANLKMSASVSDNIGAYRSGHIALDNGRELPLICRHSKATSALTYLHPLEINDDWRRLVGLPTTNTSQVIDAPGTLLLGVERARLLTQGILDIFNTPDIQATIKDTLEEKIALLTILREGKQFGLSNALQKTCGYHIPELPIEKNTEDLPPYRSPDNILTGAQRERIQMAIVATGITSGDSLITLINHIQTRFKNLSHIEIIIPHATLLGLTHMLAYTSPGLSLRVHTFETLLNNQGDRGTFFPHPEFHIRPTLSQHYRAWWGRNITNQFIANIPHMGTDNTDALFDPVRQIRTLNGHLQKTYQTSLANVLARHLA